MEALHNILHPYKDLIGNIASYLTMAQFFSGGFICWDIRKKGNTDNISPIPFIGGITMGFAMLKYGLILQDSAMLKVNIVAIVLNVIYSVLYYYYTTDKWNEFLKPLSIGTAIVAVLWGYTEFEDSQLVEFRYGLISTALMLILLGAPLLGVKEIIEKKDASEIPFVLTFMGTLVTFSWLLYAIVLMNEFMIVQNVLGFILCAVQLTLIFLYPGKGQDGKPSPSLKKKKY